MKKSVKLILIIVGVFIVLFLAAIGIGGWFVYHAILPTTNGSLPEVNAFLRNIEGDVTYTRDGASFVATDYLALKEGDIVKTGAHAGAAIYWSGYGRTVLEENTEVTVSRAERPGKDGLRARLHLEAGRTWTRIQKLLGANSDMTIESSDVVATVRGTSFGIDHTGDAVQVRVLESKVAVGQGQGDFTSDDFIFTEALKVDAGHKLLSQQSQFGDTEALTSSDLEDPLLVEGNQRIPEEDLEGCSALNLFEFWTELVQSISYLQAHPRLLDTADGEAAFIGWLPNRYRLCATAILSH